MKKVSWPKIKFHDNKLIRPFQVKDQANRTLWGRARWLAGLVCVSILLLLLVQNRWLNLLIHRDYLDEISDQFVKSFYPAYDSAYFWLNYQGNLAANLDEIIGENANNRQEMVQNWVDELGESLEQNALIEEIQLGIAGTSEQWRSKKDEAGNWQLGNEVKVDFSNWLVSQNLATDQIYWAESWVDLGERLALFWLRINEKGEKVYFLITVSFPYQENLRSRLQNGPQGAAVFWTENNQRQIFPLGQVVNGAELAPNQAELASENATLQKTPFFVNWNFLLTEDIWRGSDEEGLRFANLDRENFWLKTVAVQTQTNYRLLTLVLPARETTLTLGLPINLVAMLVTGFVGANLVVFCYYYLQFSRRYYFTNQIKDIMKDGENAMLEFKSSLRYDFRKKELNKVLETVMLKSIAAFNNTDGGMIIVGLDDQGKVVGLKNDYQTLKKPDKDGFELHLRALISQAYGEHFAARRIEILFPILNKEEVCVVRIKKGRAAIYTTAMDKNGGKTEKFYIRMGNSSKEIEKPSDIVAYQKERFGWRLRLGKK